ncbi:MAG: hypothetical protein AB1758_23865 [Candidatus Eremiobacterota bacterium]
MNPLFGDFDVRLDPWDPGYGTELAFDPTEEAEPDQLALELELPPDDWKPLRPESAALPNLLQFIDGVRRIEARVLVRTSDEMFHGAFGSYALGSVTCFQRVALCEHISVARDAITGSGYALPAHIPVSRGLTYIPASALDSHPDAPLRKLQERMRAAEEDLARKLAQDPDTLVVMDGPLSFEAPTRGMAVGFIKRMHRLYLPQALLGVLASLPPGHRTPVFGLRSSRRFARFSWFLRLAPGAPCDSEYAGLARLEVAEAVGLDQAIRLADATALTLPRYAPGRSRDPRSPQNLLPIGALEGVLRRRLGDQTLIRRQLETLLSRRQHA